MGERTAYTDGEPCAVNLMTPDPAASQRFYGSLFGWDFMPTGPEAGNVVPCLLRGRSVAALIPQPPDDADTPPSWRVFLACSDADALAAAVTANGGTVLTPPVDFFAAGRQFVAADPTGAVFGVWQGGAFAGAGLVDEPGTTAWTGLTTNDGEKADAFYRALFGYEQVRTGQEMGLDHTTWSLAGKAVSGRLAMGPGYPVGVPPHWTVYFGAADVDAAAEAAVANGAKLEYEPFDSPLGRVAIVTDPVGAPFCLLARAGTES